MIAQSRYPWRSVAAGRIAAWAMLLLAPVIEQPGSTPLLRSSHVSAAPPATAGPNQAGQKRPGTGAGAHGEHAVKSPPAPTENVMTVSPERLQAVGVKFELARRRSLDRVVRTVGQVEI